MATRQSSRKSTSRKTSSSRSGGGGSRKGADDKRRSGSQGEGGRGASASRGSKGVARKAATKRESSGGSSSRSAAAKRGGKSSGGRASKTSGRGGRMDALKLLKEDHDRVDAMFKRYERMKEGDERKRELMQQILEDLRVHAQVEEELFYPALRTLFEEGERKKEIELIEEADVEHETVKWLMEQLEGGDQADEGTTDARVKVLGEYVKHHVQEEEGQIFKAAKKVDVDLEELGRQLDARKRQLMGQEPAGGEGGEGGMQINEPAQMASAANED
jgi:hemerythrin superfamily protein